MYTVQAYAPAYGTFKPEHTDTFSEAKALAHDLIGSFERVTIYDSDDFFHEAPITTLRHSKFYK